MRIAGQVERGSALVVALMMLVVLTVLAITGMNIASTELVMAGGEQDRTRAFSAAEIGVERAIREIIAGDVDAVPGNVVDEAATDVDGSSVNASSGTAVERYETSTAYRGETSLITNNSVEKFSAFHFEITSRGTSARGAQATHVQGVLLVNNAGNGQN